MIHKNVSSFDSVEIILGLIMIFGGFMGSETKNPSPKVIYISHLFFTFIIMFTQLYTNNTGLLSISLVGILLYFYSKTVNKNCFLTTKQLKSDKYVQFYNRDKRIVTIGNQGIFYYSCVILLLKIKNIMK